MKGNGGITKCMGRVCIDGRMGRGTMGVTHTVRSMVLECMCGGRVESTWGIGRRGGGMGRENTTFERRNGEKGYGKTTSG